ncbi:MAG: amidohydrolase family protein [Candidatus Brocadiaceae bacterium]|nr:amidohydrolase family protein [Candidatus Brocadiaceae bacterium]
MLAPALLDVQVNGFAGHDFNRPDAGPEEAAAVVRALGSAGVALCCPTVVTASFDHMAACLRAVNAACADEAVAAAIPAVHVEGPCISPDEGPRGAHPQDHVRPPEWDEFRRLQDASGGRIGIVTLAPELPGATAFIERLSEAGIVPAIGHTNASPADVDRAVEAGARLSTHLGNGSHALLPRHENYIWRQMAEDRLWASVIPDGHHLPGYVLKCMIRGKQVARTILVSDAVNIAGLPAGEYEFAGRPVVLTPAGKIQLKGTPFLAGSSLELARGVANAVRLGEVSLAEAVRMATLNPARLLGIDDRYGSIEPGKDADLLLFRWDEAAARIEVVRTILQGRTVFEQGNGR